MDIENLLNKMKDKYLTIIKTQNEKIEILMNKIKKQNQKIEDLINEKNEISEKNLKLNEKLSNFIIKYNEEKSKNMSNKIITNLPDTDVVKKRSLFRRRSNTILSNRMIKTPRSIFNSSKNIFDIFDNCLDLNRFNSKINTKLEWNDFFLIENIIQIGPSYDLLENINHKIGFENIFNFIGNKKFKDYSIMRFINPTDEHEYQTIDFKNIDDLEKILIQDDTLFYHFAINSDIHVDHLKNNKILYQTNKNLFQYYYCLEMKDFILSKDLSKIYVFKKYMIIKSYYCMTYLFKKLLLSIKEYIKGIRYDLFLEEKEKNVKDYSNIMYSNFYETILKDIYLKKLTINNMNNNNFFFNYEINDNDLILKELCIDEFNILNYINFTDFIF